MSPEANKQTCRDHFKAFLARDAAWMEKRVAKPACDRPRPRF